MTNPHLQAERQEELQNPDMDFNGTDTIRTTVLPNDDLAHFFRSARRAEGW